VTVDAVADQCAVRPVVLLSLEERQLEVACRRVGDFEPASGRVRGFEIFSAAPSRSECKHRSCQRKWAIVFLEDLEWIGIGATYEHGDIVPYGVHRQRAHEIEPVGFWIARLTRPA